MNLLLQSKQGFIKIGGNMKIVDGYDKNNTDIKLALNLEFNLVDYAKYILENRAPHNIIKIKIYVICLGSFYELYFKYRLGKINESLIWERPEKYQKDKHREADFQSKKASELLAYAKNFNWIDESEKSIIEGVNDLRNRFVHFSLCEQDDSITQKRVVSIENDFFDKNLALMKKLLLAIDTDLQANYLYALVKPLLK